MDALRRHPIVSAVALCVGYLIVMQGMLLARADPEPRTWATLAGLAFVLYAPLSVAILKKRDLIPGPADKQLTVLIGLAVAPIFVTGALASIGAAVWPAWCAFGMAALITFWAAWSTRIPA
jgi:hypothetical protein